MRFTFVITAMGCGGAERIMADLANDLAGRGHDITLLVLYPGQVYWPLDPAVDLQLPPAPAGVRGTHLPGRLLRWLQRPLWLRRHILDARPDAVLSFIDVANVITLLATLGTGIPVIASEHIYPPVHRIKLHYRALRRLLYPGAAAVTVLTRRAREWATSWLQPDQVRVLPNPVRRPEIAEGGCEAEPEVTPPEGHCLISVGRLIRQKRFDRLITAFHRLATRHPDWSLLILGEGELRSNLERQIDELDLSNRCLLPGTVKNPHAVLTRCHLFALSSDFEGFPVALCEAMACGLPVVSVDCPTGPAEIIRDGIDGILVPAADTDALATTLDRLMSDEEERRRLAARAPDILERFDAGEITGRWEELLTQVGAGEHRNRDRGPGTG